MDIIHKSFRTHSLKGNWVITIGNFDGFHLGHQQLVQQVLEEGKRYDANCAILTFDPHPKIILQPKVPVRQIYDLHTKLIFFEQAQLDACFIIPFTNELANLEPEEFAEKLFSFIDIKKVIVGYDFNFGKSRSGSAGFLEKEAVNRGIDFHQLEPVKWEALTVSSTMIRRLLFEGDFSEVETLLGRKWSINGIVIKGRQLGRKTGFPTLNLKPEIVLPVRNGVYFITAEVETRSFNGIANIGFRPTLDDHELVVEAHLFDVEENLYGKDVQIFPIKFLREEQKFDSIDHLARQIGKDVEQARQYFSNR